MLDKVKKQQRQQEWQNKTVIQVESKTEEKNGESGRKEGRWKEERWETFRKNKEHLMLIAVLKLEHVS